jgi:WD40 domain-containing protein
VLFWLVLPCFGVMSPDTSVPPPTRTRTHPHLDTGYDKTVRLWSLSDTPNPCVSVFHGHASFVSAVDFNPYGNLVYVFVFCFPLFVRSEDTVGWCPASLSTVRKPSQALPLCRCRVSLSAVGKPNIIMLSAHGMCGRHFLDSHGILRALFRLFLAGKTPLCGCGTF